MTEASTPSLGAIIGIDLGTTSVKAGLFTRDGRALAHASHAYPTHRPAPGHVEQSPEDWLTGIVTVIDRLLEHRDASAILAVGIGAQINTDVFADAEGRPLAPAITWQDTRAAIEAAELEAAISAKDKHDWWGAEMPIGPSLTLPKMLWMARHRPEVWARTAMVLAPRDWCLMRLTGRAVSDPISAFGQVGADHRYIAPLLDRLPGARAKLPPLVRFTDVVGEMALGSTARRVPVVAGTMDAWANLFGCGVCRPGQGMYVSGTSEILALAGRERIGAPGVVTFAPIEGLVVSAAPTQSGADSLRWWAALSGRTPAEIAQLAESADRHGRPLLFLPHMEGERAPLWDSEIRGAFIGLDAQTTPAEMALAVMEGVALSARHAFDALTEAAGFTPDHLLYGGGGARSDLWSQIRADCLRVPLHRFDDPEVGCLGAAIMAAVGAGVFASLSEAIAAMTHTSRVFAPDAAFAPRYAALYDSYKNAIDALRPLGRIAVS